MLVVAIGALQILLDKGQEDDWFSSRLILTCAVIAVVGLTLFIWRELVIEHPILDLRLFKRRNTAMSQFVLFMVGVALYSTTVLIPQFLQEIMGYTAGNPARPLPAEPSCSCCSFPLPAASRRDSIRAGWYR